MSIKKLFDDKNRKNSGKLLKANSLNTLAREVEDPEQIVEAEKKRLEFVPPVDYSKPENFAKFGSAEEYYKNAFSHVANFYPYDGTSREKLKFENNLNPFEKYIFDVDLLILVFRMAQPVLLLVVIQLLLAEVTSL